ncbi:asparagine synthase (glutamine-hydrolyzing) [Streptomyces sodiiphilus]|uniref:asparagine synthase (glutamine-hydrolyzing) n=1 Tax=Streptomyces sodiiphilus TaxID=226217 RepID=UPI0031D8F29F
MCRIFGTIAATATRRELDAVSARQRHGGPDAHRVITGRGWSLGAGRLAVTDPAGGAQPYRLDTAPGIAVVLNGEIYNHRDLRRRLAGRGHVFPDSCDGSVLPALYAEHGADFARHLEGMFAVAVIDLRATPRLVLATDDYGMKSVYLHTTRAGGVYFASELSALLAFSRVPAGIRPEALDELLSTKVCLGSRTALRGIRSLPPGTTAVADADGTGLRLRRRRPAAPSPAPGGLRPALRREVRRLARADVPVCALTSGGLDSGLVTALAAERARERGERLHSFHLTYRGTWPAAEDAFARSVAARSGTVHHTVRLDPADFAELLPRTVWHLGQPNADPITLSTYALFRAVRQEGFTVALTGDGADELFAGYARVGAALRAPAGDGWVQPYIDSLAAVPAPLRRVLYTPEYRAFLAERGSVTDRMADRLRGAGEDRLDVIGGFETSQRMPAYHLRRLDHLSMAWAVETRMPFLQPSVGAFARTLPGWARTGKKALRGAAGELLPPEVLARPKQPFTLPVTHMLAPGRPLMELARMMLAPERMRAGGRLDPLRVTGLLDRQGRTPSAEAAMAIWTLLVNELWEQEIRALRPAPLRPAPVERPRVPVGVPA